MKKKIIIGVAVVVALIVGFFVFSGRGWASSNVADIYLDVPGCDSQDANNFSKCFAMCGDALDKFYGDILYEYYWSCMGYDEVVEYKDGSKETVEEALKSKKIGFRDLDDHGVFYYKKGRFFGDFVGSR